MSSVDDYLAKLPDDRRAAIARVRDEINKNLPPGFEETLQYGMISWVVPESVLPAKQVYNKQPLCLAGLASQKNHMAVYLMSVYGDPEERSWFETAYEESGKKLDMGQSCVRFKSIDALPVELIGEAISHVSVDRYVDRYQQVRADLRKGRKAADRPSAAKTSKRSAAKKSAAKPVATKRAAKPSKKSAAKSAATKRAAKPSKKTAAKSATNAAAKSAANKFAAKSAAKKSAAKSSANKSAAKSAATTGSTQTAAKSTGKKSSSKKATARRGSRS